MADKSNLGKWAEKEVEEVLRLRSDSSVRFAWHRYPDARAARGAIASQPADYLVAIKGEGVIHLEVKETAQRFRLPKDKLSQYGTLKKFEWAGVMALVVIYRSTFKDWTYLTDDDLFSYDECPASFPFIKGRDFQSASQVLKELLP